MKNKRNVLIGVLIVVCISLLVALLLVVFLPRSKSTKNELVDSPVADYLARELLSRINFSADPCDDFYEYSCGRWQIDHPLPSDRTAYNAEILISEEVGNEIIDALQSVDVRSASDGLKFVKTFYEQCMNTNKMEERRGKWLGRLLSTGKAEDSQFPGFDNGEGKWPLIDRNYVDPEVSIEKQIGRLKSTYGIDTFLYTFALESQINSSQSVIWITGTMLPLGLGLAAFSLDYYLDPEYHYVLDAYTELQRTVAQLLAQDSGFGEVTIDLKDVNAMLQVEIDIAKLINQTMDEDDERLHSINDLKQTIPEFAWNDLFESLFSHQLRELASTSSVLYVSEPSFIKGLSKLFKRTSRRDLQNYLIWRLIMYSLNFLSSDYRDALAEFRNQVAQHNITQTSQQSTCLAFIRGNYELPNLGFGTAEALIRTGFNASTQKQALSIAENIRKTLSTMLSENQWMDEETKSKAKLKAENLLLLVGYPEFVSNVTQMNEYYQDLKVSETVTFGTLNLALRGWSVRKNFELVGNTTDRLYFRGSPVLTNAWYQQNRNSIVVPIGELHAPAFGKNYLTNMVYGALGALIGHEISHGFFDPTGAEYNEIGELQDWWTDESKKNFKERQECIVTQFDSFCYNGSHDCVNGRMTLSENLADLAGLQLSYRAQKHYGQSQRLAKAPMFDSDQQLFFLSFPIYWCGEQTKDSLERQLIIDVHSPPKFRVNGALRNFSPFAKAFKCSIGSFMNPHDRCTL
ncbi:Phosphate-regulating neutral endopeptidase [Aphelenchoides besseyi]|nr:Phosphate-regulating neutral endopeptidase [Aphelenchoides besseyi]